MSRDSPPEHTADGRYVVIDGRRWRATDPDLPPDAAARLRTHLMAARRAVGAALRAHDEEGEREARRRVHTAKVALGERGAPGGTRPMRNAGHVGWTDSRRWTGEP
ncbi:hypothetical protein GCM10020254_80110 [Streptomyces goshikiensis]